MNKKADITITILVIGIFIVCTLAIFSFISGVGKAKQSFASIGLLEAINSVEEKIEFTPSLYKIEKNGFKINVDKNSLPPIEGSYSTSNEEVLVKVKYTPQ